MKLPRMNEHRLIVEPELTVHDLKTVHLHPCYARF